MPLETGEIFNPDPGKLKSGERYVFDNDTTIPHIPDNCSVHCKGKLTVIDTGGSVEIISDKDVYITGYQHGSRNTVDARHGDIIFSGNLPYDIDALAREENIKVNVESPSYAPVKLTAIKGSITINSTLHNLGDTMSLGANTEGTILEAPEGKVTIKNGELACTTLKANSLHILSGNLTCKNCEIGTGGVMINRGSVVDGTKLKVQSGNIDIPIGAVRGNSLVETIDGDINCETLGSDCNLIAHNGNINVSIRTENKSIASAPQGKITVHGRVESGSVIKARDGIEAGTIEKDAWCESCGGIEGKKMPGSYVKANQPEIKDYFGMPNPFAKLRSRGFKTQEQIFMG